MIKKLDSLGRVRLIFLILFVGFLVYANSLPNAFVWDDEEQIVNNPYIKSWQNLPQIFSGSTFSSGGAGLTGWYYKPIMSLWFMGNFSLWKLNPFGFHLAQILLHLTNATLIFLFFTRFFSKITALFGALLFAVHPALTEAVVYPASSQELLYTFFLLLIFITTGNELLQKISPLIFLLALLSKESAIIALPLISHYLYFLLKDKDGAFYFGLLGFFATLFYLILRLAIAGIPLSAPHLSPISQAPLLQRLLTIPFELCSYLRLIFFPLNLFIAQHQVIGTVSDLRFLAALPLTLFFLIVTIILAIKAKKVTARFFLLWFFCSIFIVLNVFPLDMTIAERWLYFPLIGFLGFTLSVVSEYKQKIPARLIYLVLIILFLFSARTVIRNANWRNGLTLFRHDSAYAKDSFDLQNNLGVELFRVGKTEEAKPYFERSIKLMPKWWTSYSNLGAVYERKGDLIKAQELYEKSIKNGDYYLAYENLCFLLIKTDSLEEASKLCQEGTRRFPGNARLWQVSQELKR
ncbi:tetratricopeptide repeat protein [Candidatus Shapirobacteria bacterium]|nr:tetratricopeptide repeat protein [Candidatus Shapirobacteria bacterium]